MPSKPISGVVAIDSIGPTEAKVTPIITGSRIPTPGKPMHCTNVASPQANKSALIRKGHVLRRKLERPADNQGNSDRAGIHYQDMLQAERQQAGGRKYLIDGMDFGAHGWIPPVPAPP